MKHLTLLLILSASLAAFSQARIDTVHIGALKLIGRNDRLYNHIAIGQAIGGLYTTTQDISTPDTLRAICLVTLFQNGISLARMGFVVIEHGKRPVYLDCRKRALKLPQVGWGYEVVGANTK
jgi:hypothetical protein